MRVMGPAPQYPYDPNTTPSCSWWFDNHDNVVSCEDFPLFWDLAQADWTRWNPSLKDSCDAWVPRTSWCVEGLAEPPVPGAPETLTTITTTAAPPAPPTTTTTTTSSSSTVTRNNGIQTPQPIQEGMTYYCNKFYYVPDGANCAQILADNKISMADLFAWNPAVGQNCNSLWAHVYICVGRIPTFNTIPLPIPLPPTTTAAPTRPPNGVETPKPIQEGMVTNCKKFHFVSPGDRCAQILAYNNISVADLYRWNPAVGPNCQGMWASTYVCVGV